MNISQYILGGNPPCRIANRPMPAQGAGGDSVGAVTGCSLPHPRGSDGDFHSLRVDGENVAGNLIPMKDGRKSIMLR